MSQSTRKPRLLIVEDDPVTAELISHAALKNGYVPIIRATAEAARDTDLSEISAALLDLQLPDGDGFDILSFARRHHPQLPCFVLTARDCAESAVSALKAGAVDYFTKPFEPARIFASLRGVVGVAAVQPHSLELPVTGDWKSPAMIKLERAAAAAVSSHSPVLLVGEAGTGKRSLATSLHARSCRSDFPFASVDTRSLDPAALEQELFGGEIRQPSAHGVRKRGKIEVTHGGTLFIERIELLAPPLQSRLLDALEMRMEAGQGPWPDFRLIASAEEALEPRVEAGSFRRDLFFRLAVTTLHVPRLRDVPEDLPIWCERILTEICLSRRCRRPLLTRGATEALLDHAWPGNLDELRQVLDHAVSVAGSGIIGIEELPAGLSSGPLAPGPDQSIGFARMDDLERVALVAALEACNGNRRRAAKRLGVSIRTIYNMIDRHALRGSTESSDAP
jgi:DNA-binding NtrC family response regulator